MPRGGRRARAAALTAGLVLALAASVTACSDDGGDGDGTKTPSPTAETTTAAPSPTDTASPSPTGGGEPADPAAAQAEITKNFEDFFNPKVPLDKKAGLLEGGEEMRPLMQQFAGSEQAKGVEVKVTGVSFSSPTEAAVSYSLAVGGATVLPNGAGTAVLEDGTWKVSKVTLCGLVGLSGTPGPGCTS
ncbi:hypothetical protein AB0M28_20925 [Streptomyces sp. NPDC051940]|uniref:hypothetical protein n=1 Tax=Streptomyces sp. NPDC051940 TaxID=3155675 RepID=UPI003448CDA1